MFALEGRRDCRRVIHRRKEEEEKEEEGERGLLPSYSLTYLRFSFDTALFSPLLLRPPPPPSFNDFFHPLATEILEASTLVNPFPWCKGHPLKRKNIGGREKNRSQIITLSFPFFPFPFLFSPLHRLPPRVVLFGNRSIAGHPRLRALYFTPIHFSVNRGKYRRIVSHAGN